MKKLHTRRIEGTLLNPLARGITKLNFRLIASHFAIAFHSHVRTRTIHQPQARYVLARLRENPTINQKSGHLFSSFADCEFAQFIGTDEPSFRRKCHCDGIKRDSRHFYVSETARKYYCWMTREYHV